MIEEPGLRKDWEAHAFAEVDDTRSDVIFDVREVEDPPRRRPAGRRRRRSEGATLSPSDLRGQRQPRAAPRTGEQEDLLRSDKVKMTILAQDLDVADGRGPVRAQVAIPAERLSAGPRSHRFHVVDVAVGTNQTRPPVRLTLGADPWTYVDRWQDDSISAKELADDADFRAQNVFAIASHVLALFEQHLGRRISWRSGFAHLYLIPDALLGGNAHYSPDHAAVLFGYLSRVGSLPAVHTSLSFDVIAHEMTHAVLDGLRPRYVEPGLPDQLAFHEALADLVALLSAFGLPGLAERILDRDGKGRIAFESDATVDPNAAPDAQRAARAAGRAAFLRSTPLSGLAEQLGRRKLGRTGEALPPGSTALRRSVDLEPRTDWRTDPTFASSHRRAEVLVAAVMQTLVTIWAERLEPLATDGGMDAARIAEEGVKAAEHLLAMVLRAIDYLPNVELEFNDVIDAILTSDRRLVPEDAHHYRDALELSFAAFGIVSPVHRIVDRDGVATSRKTPKEAKEDAARMADYGPDPDASPKAVGITYQHLNLESMRVSPDEVYQFIWNNSSALEIDVRFTTKVERVLSSTRVGPDGLVVKESLAEYTQRLRTTAGDLPPGMRKPAGMDSDATVEMWGGGVLVFDQFGRFRLHQSKPLLDVVRQQERLDYLFGRDLHDRHGDFGTTDGTRTSQRFALLHSDSVEATW